MALKALYHHGRVRPEQTPVAGCVAVGVAVGNEGDGPERSAVSGGGGPSGRGVEALLGSTTFATRGGDASESVTRQALAPLNCAPCADTNINDVRQAARAFPQMVINATNEGRNSMCESADKGGVGDDSNMGNGGRGPWGREGSPRSSALATGGEGGEDGNNRSDKNREMDPKKEEAGQRGSRLPENEEASTGEHYNRRRMEAGMPLGSSAVATGGQEEGERDNNDDARSVENGELDRKREVKGQRGPRSPVGEGETTGEWRNLSIPAMQGPLSADLAEEEEKAGLGGGAPSVEEDWAVPNGRGGDTGGHCHLTFALGEVLATSSSRDVQNHRAKVSQDRYKRAIAAAALAAPAEKRASFEVAKVANMTVDASRDNILSEKEERPSQEDPEDYSATTTDLWAELWSILDEEENGKREGTEVDDEGARSMLAKEASLTDKGRSAREEEGVPPEQGEAEAPPGWSSSVTGKKGEEGRVKEDTRSEGNGRMARKKGEERRDQGLPEREEPATGEWHELRRIKTKAMQESSTAAKRGKEEEGGDKAEYSDKNREIDQKEERGQRHPRSPEKEKSTTGKRHDLSITAIRRPSSIGLANKEKMTGIGGGTSFVKSVSKKVAILNSRGSGRGRDCYSMCSFEGKKREEGEDRIGRRSSEEKEIITREPHYLSIPVRQRQSSTGLTKETKIGVGDGTSSVKSIAKKGPVLNSRGSDNADRSCSQREFLATATSSDAQNHCAKASLRQYYIAVAAAVEMGTATVLEVATTQHTEESKEELLRASCFQKPYHAEKRAPMYENAAKAANVNSDANVDCVVSKKKKRIPEDAHEARSVQTKKQKAIAHALDSQHCDSDSNDETGALIWQSSRIAASIAAAAPGGAQVLSPAPSGQTPHSARASATCDAAALAKDDSSRGLRDGSYKKLPLCPAVGVAMMPTSPELPNSKAKEEDGVPVHAKPVAKKPRTTVVSNTLTKKENITVITSISSNSSGDTRIATSISSNTLREPLTITLPCFASTSGQQDHVAKKKEQKTTSYAAVKRSACVTKKDLDGTIPGNTLGEPLTVAIPSRGYVFSEDPSATTVATLAQNFLPMSICLDRNPKVKVSSSKTAIKNSQCLSNKLSVRNKASKETSTASPSSISSTRIKYLSLTTNQSSSPQKHPIIEGCNKREQLKLNNKKGAVSESSRIEVHNDLPRLTIQSASGQHKHVRDKKNNASSAPSLSDAPCINNVDNVKAHTDKVTLEGCSKNAGALSLVPNSNLVAVSDPAAVADNNSGGKAIVADECTADLAFSSHLVYFPPHLKLWGVNNITHRCVSMGSSELDQGEIKSLLASVGLKMPDRYTMNKLGSVSCSDTSRRLQTCILFKKDESSAGIIIFDLVRVATKMWEHAAQCLETFVVLLRQHFPRSKIILRAGVARQDKKVRGFYEKEGFVRGVPKGLSNGLFCGHLDCDVHHLVVQKSSLNKSSTKRQRSESPLRPLHHSSRRNSHQHHTKLRCNSKEHSKQLQLSQLHSEEQNEKPKYHARRRLQVFFSSHSRLKVVDADGYDAEVLEVAPNNVISEFLCTTGYRPLKSTRKISSVCLKSELDQLVCCLLFERDDTFLAADTRIFDIARFTVGLDLSEAALCLNAFTALLCQNFPSAKIIARSAVVDRAQAFYQSSGFKKGAPRGLPAGPYCGHSDCSTYHLIIGESSSAKNARKKKR